MICEKCWADAYPRACESGRSQYDCYLELLKERKDNPCMPEEPEAAAGAEENGA